MRGVLEREATSLSVRERIMSHLDGEAKSLVLVTLSDTWESDESLSLGEEKPSTLHELHGGDMALLVLTKKISSCLKGLYCLEVDTGHVGRVQK